MAEPGTLDVVEVDERLDFEPRCDWNQHNHLPKCGRAARWVARSVCCGYVALACDPHKAITIAQLAEGRRCLLCSNGDPVQLTWTPIGGARA